MEERAIIEELLAMLEHNDIAVRTEPMGGRGGGLCKLKDKTLFFVDSEASAADTAAICARTVGQLLEIEKMYIKPQVRDFIEEHVSEVDPDT
jgi:hypothetical protein